MIYAHRLVTSLLDFAGSSRELLTEVMHLGSLTTNADYCEDPFERPHLVRVSYFCGTYWDFLTCRSVERPTIIKFHSWVIISTRRCYHLPDI